MGYTTPSSFMHLFLVEDDPSDRAVMADAVDRCPYPVQLHVHDGGDDAHSFLLRQGTYQGLPQPDVIFLDYHLPRHSHASLVATARAVADLKQCPIILYSGTYPNPDLADPAKRDEALKQLGGINDFLVKPVTPTMLSEICRYYAQLAA